MAKLDNQSKSDLIVKLANDKINNAVFEKGGSFKLPHEVVAKFIYVLENAELIRGFTKNDILKCRQIGIAIGYYVKAERYIVRQAKDHNEAFIQNGFAYKLAK